MFVWQQRVSWPCRRKPVMTSAIVKDCVWITVYSAYSRVSDPAEFRDLLWRMEEVEAPS